MSSKDAEKPSIVNRVFTWFKIIVLNGFLLLILLELGSAICIESGLIPARVPPYSMEYSNKGFWADVNEHFGVWHPSDIQFRHIRNCYDLIYTSNSYGARDKERSLESDEPRVVVLGDSFIEGWGVENDQRISEVLEKKTGLAHLNFGTAGDFGPIHEYLLYRHLASQFDHQSILLGILPDNDFADMDPNNRKNRYFPFLDGNYPDYTLRYTLDSLNQSSWSPDVQGKDLRNQYLLNYTYSRNLYNYIGALVDRYKSKSGTFQAASMDASPFFTFKTEDWNKMKFSYERIVEEAGSRNVCLFTIPRIRDLVNYQKNQESPLGKELSEWAAQYQNVHFLDLLPLIATQVPQQDWPSLFIDCDHHWTPRGHELAASLIVAHFGEVLYP